MSAALPLCHALISTLTPRRRPWQVQSICLLCLTLPSYQVPSSELDVFPISSHRYIRPLPRRDFQGTNIVSRSPANHSGKIVLRITHPPPPLPFFGAMVSSHLVRLWCSMCSLVSSLPPL